MKTPAPEIFNLAQWGANAQRRVDLAKLAWRRRVATSRRTYWQPQAMSDAGLVQFTAAEAFLGELLDTGDLEDAERQLLLDLKSQLAARLEAGDREAVTT